jgi:thiol-disulfide isomerase/thioredoxin
MPHLQSIRLEHGDQVKILAINFVEKGDPVSFMKEQGYDFTVLPDGDDVASIYGVYGTPGVILVDQDQQIRFDLRHLPPPDLP